MRLFAKFAVLLLPLSVSAIAQNYPFPRSNSEPPAICSGCFGLNAAGEPNDGLPTYPYDTPMQLHTGRLFDSSTTADTRFGMRTIRGTRPRPVIAGNRLYLGLGATVGAYALDTFFTSKLQLPMVGVNTIPTGNPYSGRNPYEKLAKPDRFFYPESTSSGWTTPLVDGQQVLNDFSADDRGLIYIGTEHFGWGIVSDPGGTDGSHLPSVKQVMEGAAIENLIPIRVGDTYYAVVALSSAIRIYDVTTPASPVFIAQRSGSTNTIKRWSVYEGGDRVAVRNGDGHVRIYTYAEFIAGGTPLADITPAGRFNDLSFDDDGNVWIAQSAIGSSVTPTVLLRLTPSGNGYTSSNQNYSDTPFLPTHIHAAAGYVAIGGIVSQQTPHSEGLRLLRVVNGVAQMVDTDEFFEKYYSAAPAGYANPYFGYSTPVMNVGIVAHGAKTYLFYSTYGLGDVYELGNGSRITAISPMSGIPAGGTNVTIFGSGFAAGSTVTFDGILASSTFVDSTQMTAVSPMHASGAVDVIVSPPGELPMMSPRKFTYELTTPQAFVATATSTTSVGMSWNAVTGATYYEVSRRSPDGTWIVIGTPATTSFNDGGRTAETTYVYRVRAADAAANFSANSAIDLATTMTGDAATIVAGAPILASDLAHLRTRVNAVRAAAGMSATSFTGGSAGQAILATHITDLRGALNAARLSLGIGNATFTDNSVSGIAIKALHFNQLLDAMR